MTRRVRLGLGGLAGLVLAASVAVAYAAVGDLTPQGCIDDNDSGVDTCAVSIDGLQRPEKMVISPDGNSVYAVGDDDDAVAMLERDVGSGALTPIGCVDDNDTGADSCAQTADGLAGAHAVTVSPDGKSVYVAADVDDALARFKRNPATGELTPKGCIQDNDSATDSCAQSTDGLDGAHSIVVSHDGRWVYVASEYDEAIVRFKRSTRTGALTPIDCVDDNDTGADDCAQSTDGLGRSHQIAMSPDGKSLYAASIEDDAVVRFKLRTNGVLVAKGCIDDNDTGIDACKRHTNGLEGARSVTVSPDGSSVYVGSSGDDAVVQFERDTISGALHPSGCIDDNDTGDDDCEQSADGLDYDQSVAVSPDGTSAYVTGLRDDAVAILTRDPGTGGLTPTGCIDDNDTGSDACGQSTDGLDGAASVGVSPDGADVYVSSIWDDAIVRFDRETVP
jgi:6-phosphogluconolactonase (cycloisomerase 2 family)